jgi:hypothetical protein
VQYGVHATAYYDLFFVRLNAITDPRRLDVRVFLTAVPFSDRSQLRLRLDITNHLNMIRS